MITLNWNLIVIFLFSAYCGMKYNKLFKKTDSLYLSNNRLRSNFEDFQRVTFKRHKDLIKEIDLLKRTKIDKEKNAKKNK